MRTEKQKTWSKEYYHKNREKITAYLRERYHNGKQKKRLLSHEMSEEQKLSKRKSQAKWYRENKEKRQKYLREWFSKNKDRRQAYNATRRGYGTLDKKTVQRVYEENIVRHRTLTCYLCLDPVEFGSDSIDHKIPMCRGGTNEKSNLAIAHKKCNSKKSHRTTDEYLMPISKGGSYGII